jgi:hypothetical protein
MNIRLLGAEWFHADGRTDTTELIVAFRNFVNLRRNERRFTAFTFFAFHHE